VETFLKLRSGSFQRIFSSKGFPKIACETTLPDYAALLVPTGGFNFVAMITTFPW